MQSWLAVSRAQRHQFEASSLCWYPSRRRLCFFRAEDAVTLEWLAWQKSRHLGPEGRLLFPSSGANLTGVGKLAHERARLLFATFKSAQSNYSLIYKAAPATCTFGQPEFVQAKVELVSPGKRSSSYRCSRLKRLISLAPTPSCCLD